MARILIVEDHESIREGVAAIPWRWTLRPTELTPGEWSFLNTLLGQPGTVLSRKHLMSSALAYSMDTGERTVDTLIKTSWPSWAPTLFALLTGHALRALANLLAIAQTIVRLHGGTLTLTNVGPDVPSPVQRMAAPPPAMEPGEGTERTPDNEAAEEGPNKASLQAYQGTKIDLTA